MSSPNAKPTCLSQPVVKSVMVYRNGDAFFTGRRVVIHEKKMSSFDVFLKEVTGGVNASFGAVRNIYTPRGGHRIRQLDEIQSGEHYVAGGREAFKKLNYLDIGEPKKKATEINNEVKPVTHSRINVSARFRKPLQEPCTVFLIANGDLVSPAVRLFIPRKALNQWDRVLEMVTEKVTLRSGAVHRLFTLDGKLVESGLDLENGQFYVAVGRDKFKKLPYSELLFSKSTMRRPYGAKASSLPPAGGSGKSKGSSKSTDTGETVSPQPPKGKERHAQNQEIRKPAKSKTMIKSYAVTDNGDGVYKAGKKRSEMRGAVEIQEDEDTQTEVPVDQQSAEIVEEEENIALDQHAQHQGKYSAMNVDANPGEATEEAMNGIEEDKLNSHYEDAQQWQDLDNGGEDEPIPQRYAETNEENGEKTGHSHREEETKEGIDDQIQADSNYEQTSAPRVTITSPQESEKNEQSNDYAAVA
ncbi:doublecortin domain-containing protein 2 isoform X2 [Anolis carolinensis]|uniref:Doublecortin domain-containing protein 2 n=1 Tax=Anolis carolinensis TaxID=28377 RepID=G1KBA5_ANOCA|nr:PREDICTED: doublecortin domain-containing protein 2 isoform X1 [Anolis carolinensis]XP_008107001.1 PREDICTED: doublecortin domain-containing protein 2 isoform X1 [Anolis carolinensis]|eukprot:XP_008107000.1 PREDICTED: doublecortin domain-containing protein 2 isoform X1 [Anolis carolinensis]